MELTLTVGCGVKYMYLTKVLYLYILLQSVFSPFLSIVTKIDSFHSSSNFFLFQIGLRSTAF